MISKYQDVVIILDFNYVNKEFILPNLSGLPPLIFHNLFYQVCSDNFSKFFISANGEKNLL